MMAGYRQCPECGSDEWKQHDWDRIRTRLGVVEKAHEAVVAATAVEIAQLKLKLTERDAVSEGRQRKVDTQRRRIRQLEKRLRETGTPPYEAKVEESLP